MLLPQNLKYLNLSNNFLINIQDINLPESLEELLLMNCDISEGIEDIELPKSLKILNL